MNVEKDYEELLELFNRNKVRYCVVGSYAVAFYSKPRYTKDLDILIDSTIDNAKRIVESLELFGFSSLKLTVEDFLRKGQIIQLGFEPLRIDLLTSIKGIMFAEIWRNKKKGKYGNQKVYFIGLKDLIKAKELSGRKQDKLDLEQLKKSKTRRLS